MQFISGVGPIVYWLSNWALDYIMHIFVVICVLIIFAIQDEEAFTGSLETFGATCLLLLLFGFAVIPLSSAASFVFKTPSSGLTIMIAYHFLTGFGLVITDFILTQIKSTQDANDSLKHLYRFFPTYCLGASFTSLSLREVLAQETGGFAAKPKGVYEWDQLGGNLVMLLIEGLFFMVLTILLQYAESNISLQQKFVPSYLQKIFAAANAPKQVEGTATVRTSNRSSELEDADVIEERRTIDSGCATDAMLTLKHLRREFGPKVAVRDLCLRIQRGECFGFLGVNGAGKSTTFAMLTGSLVPTSGDALLEGMSILKDQNQIRRLIGYCPQHDALEKLMTARETLRMYAKIKDVDASKIEAEVEQLIQDLDLAKFADKPAGIYSGGNKRKLCVGIALVGNPQLVLLDEPSSGMDAASKRFLWSVIKRRTISCCTVLTTHSMEECEALCGRLGVMVDGTLRCVGPIQTLKSTYSQGYKLDLRFDVTQADPNAILALLKSRIVDADLKELEPPSMVLTVPQSAAQLSQLFSLLSELKVTHSVVECSVTQCTLEQIFIAMASKDQMHEMAKSHV